MSTKGKRSSAVEPPQDPRGNEGDEQGLPKQSERYYRMLVERGLEAVILSDAEAKYFYASPAVERVMGYTPAEALKVNVFDVVHPDDLERFVSGIREIYSHPGMVDTQSFRFRHKDGRWIWLETTSKNMLDDPEIHAVVSNYRDVTEQREAVARLEEGEARFRLMAEALPLKIVTAGPDGKITYCNPQWNEYVDPASMDLSEEFWQRVIHPDDYDRVADVWRNELVYPKLLEYECRMLRKDGEYRRHIVRGQPMLDKNGKLIRLLVLAVDIEDIERTTEERDKLEQINATLERQRSTLLTLNKSKDEFISLASHQLRTPATGVKQFLGMVLDDFAGKITSEQRRMLTRAYDSNERQINIINDLLKVAQADAGKVLLHKKKVDVVKLVTEVLSEQASKFSVRGQKVNFSTPKEAVIVRADPDRLRMVLENIIDNASKYTFEGGTITVKISRRQQKVHITVEDEGVGIASADLGRLFHKFTRLDNPLSEGVGGTGLGLYWAKKIVDLHNGTIEVTSKLHHGSVFSVVLPQ